MCRHSDIESRSLRDPFRRGAGLRRLLSKGIEFRKWLRYPPFAAFANVLVRAEKQEEALRMATELGYLLNPPPDGIRVHGTG